MNAMNPIVLVEENQENRRLFKQVFLDLKVKNRILFYSTFLEAKRQLMAQEIMPFLVFSNVLHIGESNNDSHYKDIGVQMKCPCLFFSILFTQSFVIDPFAFPPKSYFITPCNTERFKNVINSIIQYWSERKSKEIYKVQSERRIRSASTSTKPSSS
ncbi:hypothetical protein BD847_3297 [Flavobacterium cutihirudinis]|uniref:CheY-like chemotaxis protein n=1 Tax=Flavobacterium cutihirudinis TaxID=1265740 RepID=A0A3D9FQF5_9FLAO|nr:hypothetical protein [Flavobacterium cutihirudinis]RED22667.1 hypothetical protein BD847_3297 [Flavobacterium cutihirudinis]